jgi:nucleoside-diphosphate-sugar epimerase
MSTILVTGSCGQLGAELINGLLAESANHTIIASDIRKPEGFFEEIPFEYIDVMDKDRLEEVIKKYDVKQVYHLAALLSATAEKNIDLARKLNIGSLHHVLNLARDLKLEKVFWPSSIAVFGPDAKKDGTPQEAACNPTTVYGISKMTGEQWCAYYYNTFGVDVRSLRYPGLIGYKTLPGGGTTDYAVDIYHKALAGEPFECFLKADSRLPMMYMSDAVKATIDLMNADTKKLTVRTSYNVAAISFTPEEIAASIKKKIPSFEIIYAPDYRQKIASSWPDIIDDSIARRDWGWKHEFTLDRMTEDILEHLPEYR